MIADFPFIGKQTNEFTALLYGIIREPVLRSALIPTRA